MQDLKKKIVAVVAATAFTATAYYLPAETFLAFFASGLFIIPAALFVLLIQAMAGKEDYT